MIGLELDPVDLISVLLTLTPTCLPSPGEEATGREKGETGFGRAAHAVLLDAIRQVDPALAESLHGSPGLKPFTVSDLIGFAPKRGLEATRTYELRFTGLARPTATAIQWATTAGPLALGKMMRLGNYEFKVEAAATSPWTATTTYESLSAPWLLGRSAPQPRLTFRFTSPVTFKSNEMHVPLPLPAWVFGSLLEKWNAFAPVALPPETRRFAEECLALSSFELRSRPMYMKEGGVRIGAVGMARYTALNRDRYWLSVMNLLADFALFAGVGAGTTMGLGQCRRVGD